MVDPEIYPFEGHYLEFDGLRYHYLDEGQGDAVIMVHGNPSWSIYYRNLVTALRGNYRTIVPDHIGCGLSDKPGDEDYAYTLTSRVDDLARLLDHLGLKDNLTLVLHDWGGMIGMAYAARYPDRIARLIVLNTAAFRLPEDKAMPLALRLGRNTALGGFLIRRFNAFAAVAARVCCKRKPMSAALRRAYTAPYDNYRNRIATHRFVQDIPLKPGDPAYQTVLQVEQSLPEFKDRPIQIFWGLKDFVFSKEFLQRWRYFFPEAEVHAFADAGHYVLEDAAEEIIPLVQSFLSRHALVEATG